MRTKRVVALLLALSLLAVTVIAQPVAADDPPLRVFPWSDGRSVTANAGQDIQVAWAWSATSKGLVNEFLGATEHTLTLSGEGGTILYLPPVQYAQIFYVIPLPPALFGRECPMPMIYAAAWTLWLPDLAPGTYTLETRQVLRHAVNDGYHVCTVDGEPMKSPPSLYPARVEEATVTIEVLPP
jgi:hypothetical protein